MKTDSTLTTYNGSGEVVEVEFPYDPQRIAAMDLAALDILDNIGFGDRIVGVSKGSSIDYLQDYVTNDELYNLGTIKQAGMEALTAMKRPSNLFWNTLMFGIPPKEA